MCHINEDEGYLVIRHGLDNAILFYCIKIRLPSGLAFILIHHNHSMSLYDAGIPSHCLYSTREYHRLAASTKATSSSSKA